MSFMGRIGSRYLTIDGLQQTQMANLRMIANMQPDGALGRMVQYVTAIAQRFAVSITHVDTGALKASHRIDVKGYRGEIYIDPNAVNPRSLVPVREYAGDEHNRGGEHSFYQRTYEQADSFINEAAQAFNRDIAK